MEPPMRVLLLYQLSYTSCFCNGGTLTLNLPPTKQDSNHLSYIAYSENGGRVYSSLLKPSVIKLTHAFSDADHIKYQRSSDFCCSTATRSSIGSSGTNFHYLFIHLFVLLVKGFLIKSKRLVINELLGPGPCKPLTYRELRLAHSNSSS
jgi:hypothetical protein